ncbi:MAG: hypothetical protein AVDCRST_MAG52-1318, partial [uncultured Blastococcus sp.]
RRAPGHPHPRGRRRRRLRRADRAATRRRAGRRPRGLPCPRRRGAADALAAGVAAPVRCRSGGVDDLPGGAVRRSGRVRHGPRRSRLEPAQRSTHLAQGELHRDPVPRAVGRRRPARAAGTGLPGGGAAGAHRVATVRLGLRRLHRRLPRHPDHRHQGLHGVGALRPRRLPRPRRGGLPARRRPPAALAGAGGARSSSRGAVDRHSRLRPRRGGLV